MIKIKTLFACCFIHIMSNTVLFAQDTGSVISTSAMNKHAYKSASLIDIVKAPDEKCILIEVSRNEKDLQLTEFSKDLKSTRKNKYPFNADNNKSYFRTISFRDKSYILWEEYERKTKQTVLKMQEILPDELKLREPAIILDKTPSELSAYMFIATTVDNITSPHQATDKHHLYLSPDKKSIASISLKLPTRDKNDLNIMNIDVRDQQGNSVYSSSVEFPYLARKMQPIAFCTGNDHTVYGLYRIFKGENRDAAKNDSIPNFDFEIYKYDQSGSAKLCEIKTGVEFPAHDLLFEISDQNKIAMAGLYGKYGKVYMNDVVIFHEGAYLVNIDAKMPQPAYSINNKSPLTPELISAHSPYVSRPLFKKTERAFEGKLSNMEIPMDRIYGISNTKPVKLIFDKDGQITLLTQKGYGVTKSAREVYSYARDQMITTSFTTTYHYYDNYIFRFDMNGKALKPNKIPKLETARESTFSTGVLLADYNGYPQFLYMDAESNDKLANEVPPTIYTNNSPGNFHIKHIDASGELTEVKNQSITNPLEVPGISSNNLINGHKLFWLKTSEAGSRIGYLTLP